MCVVVCVWFLMAILASFLLFVCCCCLSVVADAGRVVDLVVRVVVLGVVVVFVVDGDDVCVIIGFCVVVCVVWLVVI